MPKDNKGHKWLSKLAVGCLWTLSGLCWVVLAHLNPFFWCVAIGMMDMVALRASCCGLGEATRGHDVVVPFVHAAVKSCDPSAEPNLPEPATRMCPAQTRWLPHQQRAGGECSRANMLIAGTPETLTVFRIQTKRISRRRNVGTEAAVTMVIWKRTCRHVRSCCPATELPPGLQREHSSCRSVLSSGLSGHTCGKLLFCCGRTLVCVRPQRASACWRSHP